MSQNVNKQNFAKEYCTRYSCKAILQRLKKCVDQADEEDVIETLKENEDAFHVSETFPGKFKGEVKVEEGQ